MATYKEIKGVTVQTKDSDPVVNAGSWSSGGSINTARSDFLNQFWNTNSFIAFGGGYTPLEFTAKSEEYDGTSWTEVADLNTAKNGFSKVEQLTLQLNLLVEEQYHLNQSNSFESWNGTNWTEVNDLNTAKIRMDGAGAGTLLHYSFWW